MEGGDISNVVAEGKTLVHARTFTSDRIEMDVAWLGLVRTLSRSQEINLTDLARIVRACQSLPRPILVTTDGDQGYLEDLYERLDGGYEHPFRGLACYPTESDLAVMLAWMPNTRIIDLPGKAAVYGNRFLEIPW